MTLDPIINAKMEAFKGEYSFDDNEDIIFEKYVNYQILKHLYPDFSSDANLLDKICVGGSNDMGIDGLIIAINDQPVKTVSEALDIIENRNKINISMTFIQSKRKAKFDQKEFLVFKEGIEDFLKTAISMPANEIIKEWHDILEKISQPKNLRKWKKLPDINVYYVTLGKWEKQPQILSAINSFNEFIERGSTYELCGVYCIDAKELTRIINENENDYQATIKIEQSIGLPKVEGVNRSSIYLCKAESIINLITSDDGTIRRDLFEDNVRDFQGYTNINTDIENTIVDMPDQFLLLNNGITIVCSSMNDPNMELTVEAPQIVNGCQTCNILYECHKKKMDLSSVYVVLKVISSQNDDIISNIVKGTNRQNIVYEEALETTKTFHKLLEEFIQSVDIMNQYPKLYYERRAKQFRYNVHIKVSQKINLRIMTQSFVSIFLCRPDLSVHHELKLLETFKGQLFRDEQSFYPYYVAAFITKNLDNMFRHSELRLEQKAFIFHIAFIMKEQLMTPDSMPKFFNGKDIDKYCQKLLQSIQNPADFKRYAKIACKEFEKISAEWIVEKGEKFKYGRKDSEAFTDYIVKRLNKNKEKSNIHVGKVKKVGFDRNGNIYGFIESQPEDIFFHSANHNELVDLSFEGKQVIYEYEKDRYGEETPVNIKLYEKN